MSDPAAPLKALSVETKALIIVSEYEARRMPMFQMRAVLNAIVRDDAERKTVIDMVEKDLRATGYGDDKIGVFLTDLLSASAAPSAPASSPENAAIQSTRRLRSPFAMGFENQPAGESPPPDVIAVPGSGRPPSSATTAAVTPSPPGAPLKPAPIPAPNLRRGTTASFISKTPASSPAIKTPASLPAIIKTPAPMPAVSPPLGGGSAAAEPIQPVGQRAIPRHELAFGKVMPSSTGGAPAEAVGAREIVLLADDDKRIRMVFRLRLEAAGYGVIEMGDGQEAWDRLQQGGIALAVLDMKMPGLHGLEVISRMVDKQIDIPVIVCTAYDQLESEFVVQTHRKLKYLTKPVPPDTLVSTIRQLLMPKPKS